jgi:menaquinone-dependent protoporphyrinogen oxidase
MQVHLLAMKVLITWGSKMGGTEGIARLLAEPLEKAGHTVTLAPAAKAPDVSGFDAAVIGGSLYAFRWHRDADRFIARNLRGLRKMPVWLFSSGPLDDSADKRPIPPIGQVALWLERVGAQGHMTFGGRLPKDAKGFPASAMAKTHAGDWRNPERVRAWGEELAMALPRARPRPAVEPQGHRLPWLFAHAFAAWGVCALAILGLLKAGHPNVELLVAPAVFAAAAADYFRKRGARRPLPVALFFALSGAALNAALGALLVWRGDALLATVALTWLPFVLVFVTVWPLGFFMSMSREARHARPALHT